MWRSRERDVGVDTYIYRTMLRIQHHDICHERSRLAAIENRHPVHTHQHRKQLEVDGDE